MRKTWIAGREPRRLEARQALGKFGTWLFVLLLLGQSGIGVSAAAEGPQRRAVAMMRMQQEVQFKESRWMEEIPQRWRRPKGEERTENKEVRVLRCALFDGSVWSTEKKCMRRFKGKCDIFFGVEHRMKKEEMKEQFNKEAMRVSRSAADAARITDDRAGSEDRKHTSGGVFVAVDSNLGAVVGAVQEKERQLQSQATKKESLKLG